MILNSQIVETIRLNAQRLAQNLKTKDALAQFSNSESLEEMFRSMERLLTETQMYFDDVILEYLKEDSWRDLKAILSVYALNAFNQTNSGSYSETFSKAAVQSSEFSIS
jgi:hypothetical protein